MIALDRLIALGEGEAFLGEQRIGLVELDAAIPAAEFLGHHRRGAAAEEGIEHHVAGMRAGEDQLGDELLALLRRVIGVLGHRPERDGDIGPQIGRVRVAEISGVGLAPVLGASVGVTVGRDHAAAQLHRIDVERVAVRHRAEPDILARILPVGEGAAAFLALPGDPVADREELRGGRQDRRRGQPIPADIDRGGTFEERRDGAEQTAQPGGVLIDRHAGKIFAAEFLREVVGRIQDQDVHHPRRQLAKHREAIAADRAPDEILPGDRLGREQAPAELGNLCRLCGERAVARRPLPCRSRSIPHRQICRGAVFRRTRSFISLPATRLVFPPPRREFGRAVASTLHYQIAGV